MSRPLNPSWPLWLVGTSALVFGISLGALFVATYHSDKMARQQSEAQSLRSRISLLEIALGQVQGQADSLSEPPIQTQTPTQTGAMPVPAESESGVKLKKSKELASPPRHTSPTIVAQSQEQQAPTRTPQQTAQPAPAAAATPPVQAPVQAAAPAQPPIPAVSSDEINAVVKSGRIEGVSMAKAGISKLMADGVEFNTGRKVRKGEIFPSGEKLLAIDVQTGRIITSQRQIILLDH